jgi:predicted Kef-type K+ transport protein
MATICPPAPPFSRLLNNREDVEKLSELGVLFLLFEMGLELSLDRLKSLAKYAFGMGSLQVGHSVPSMCVACRHTRPVNNKLLCDWHERMVPICFTWGTSTICRLLEAAQGSQPASV